MMAAWRQATISVATFTVFAQGALFNGAATAQRNHDARILTSPQPNYPNLATWLGIEGHCEVRFAVDEDGFPFSAMASCSLPVFCFEAKRAVMATTFIPKRVDGVEQVRTNIVYPLIFAFRDSDYDADLDPRPLEPCEPKAIA